MTPPIQTFLVVLDYFFYSQINKPRKSHLETAQIWHCKIVALTIIRYYLFKLEHHSAASATATKSDVR